MALELCHPSSSQVLNASTTNDSGKRDDIEDESLVLEVTLVLKVTLMLT